MTCVKKKFDHPAQEWQPHIIRIKNSLRWNSYSIFVPEFYDYSVSKNIQCFCFLSFQTQNNKIQEMLKLNLKKKLNTNPRRKQTPGALDFPIQAPKLGSFSEPHQLYYLYNVIHSFICNFLNTENLCLLSAIYLSTNYIVLSFSLSFERHFSLWLVLSITSMIIILIAWKLHAFPQTCADYCLQMEIGKLPQIIHCYPATKS